MGAGEILLNCIDKDGSNSGFDTELINDVKNAIKIPVIASSGAGHPGHFEDVFAKTKTDAALGAGMVSTLGKKNTHSIGVPKILTTFLVPPRRIHSQASQGPPPRKGTSRAAV